MFSQVSKIDGDVHAPRAPAISGINYYKVLSLDTQCNDADIREAYRRCALRYNPAQEKNIGAEVIFALAGEAYDVLSDPLKRSVYDQYGEDGLKNGVPKSEEFTQPYVYHGNPMRTFREFFADENPYEDLLKILREPLPLFAFPPGRGIKLKEMPLVNILFLTLSEVFHGGIKKIKIQRLVLIGDDKSTTVSMEKILTIPIKPGMLAGTRIVFVENGDEGPAKTAADIIFVTVDRPDKTYRRDGSDLYATIDIFLREALTGTTITLTTVDDRILRIPITSVVTPNYTKCVAGEGMPIPVDPKRKGDLILRFNVEFPIYMPISNKGHVKQAFKVSRAPIRDAADVKRPVLVSKTRRNIDEDIPLRQGEVDRLKAPCEM